MTVFFSRDHIVAMVIVVAMVLALGAAAPTHNSPADHPPLQVVPEIDLARYAGTWYEVARLPNRFQRECASDVTATYTLRQDGKIDVVNQCRQSTGGVKEARGLARRVKGQPGSVLEVRFAPAWLSVLPAVWGDYQVLALASDYSHALIGTPDRKYLWVLSRTPAINRQVLEELMVVAKRQGFDTDAILSTRHTSRVSGKACAAPDARSIPADAWPSRLVEQPAV